MRSDHYILDGKKVVPVDWITWAKWLENARAQRIVAQHLLENVQPWLWRDLKAAKEHRDRWKSMTGRDKHETIADLRNRATRVMVSTVFLGLDHSFGGPVPILFETLVFNGPLHDEMERYATWDEAEKGHAIMLARVKEALAQEVAKVEGRKMEGGK